MYQVHYYCYFSTDKRNEPREKVSYAFRPVFDIWNTCTSLQRWLCLSRLYQRDRRMMRRLGVHTISSRHYMVEVRGHDPFVSSMHQGQIRDLEHPQRGDPVHPFLDDYN